MIDKDYTFGTCTISCDREGCSSDIVNDGFDGYPDFMGAIDDARKEGWIIKRIDGDWYHFCSQECFEDSGVEV